jgi:hypothetical protein
MKRILARILTSIISTVDRHLARIISWILARILYC